MRKRPADYSTLSQRIRAVRTDLYGETGGPILARRLRIPLRSLARMETGAPFPGLLILKLIEVTGVNPLWLLSGDGERFDRATISKLDWSRPKMRSSE
jgi:hypothetical protein